jgi:hypothetical protein
VAVGGKLNKNVTPDELRRELVGISTGTVKERRNGES